MALPVYPMPKPSSRSAPPKLSRSQSLNLHNAKGRSPRKTQLDGCGFQSFDKTDGTRTLPPHLRKGTSDMGYEHPRHRSDFSAKIKLLFRRKSNKTSRKGGIGASDVSGGVGLPVTASEEERESGSGLPTQAVNLSISRHLMTTFMLDQNESDIAHSSTNRSSHRSTQWYDGDDEETDSKLPCWHSENKSDISRSSTNHSLHKSTQWYNEEDVETDNKLLCWDSEERLVPALGENGQLMNEEEIKLLLDSSLEGRGGDCSPHSPSASQLFTINEECVEDDLPRHTSALRLGANDSKDVGVSSSTPTVASRLAVGLRPSSDDLMNRWSIAGSGIHDSPSLRESVVNDILYDPKLSVSDGVALRCDSDSDGSSKDDAGATDEDSRTRGPSDTILCDSVDLGMNTSQSMLELPRCVAEDTPRMGRGSVLRRSASLTLGRGQKLVLQIFCAPELTVLTKTPFNYHILIIFFIENVHYLNFCVQVFYFSLTWNRFHGALSSQPVKQNLCPYN